MTNDRDLSGALRNAWRRVVSGAARYRNYPKLQARLRQTTKQVDRAQRRIGRLEQRAADLRATNAAERARTDENRRLYIKLLKHALMHTLYRPLDIGARSRHVEQNLDEEQTRAQGRDWPQYAQTMVGSRRLDNVRHCVETVLRDGIPGDFIETGVWRGGTVIFMRGILKAYGDPPGHQVVVADSFQGLPVADSDQYPEDAPFVHNPDTETAARAGALAPSLLAIPQTDVRRNFELYGLLDERVEFLEGWFKDTLPTVRDRAWSVIRLDGDFYESTMDGLVNLYPKLAVGGFLIIDDYSIPACKQAVADYRNEHGIDDPIQTIDWTGAFWRRGR